MPNIFNKAKNDTQNQEEKEKICSNAIKFAIKS